MFPRGGENGLVKRN